MRTLNPFIEVNRTFYGDILDLAYPAYSRPSRFSATFRSAGQSFTELDSYFLNELFLTASLFCSLFDKKRLPSEINPLINLQYVTADERYLSAQAWDIHSPGTVRLASSVVSPLMAMALFGVLATGGREAMAEPPSVSVHNSLAADPDDPCAASVGERVKGILTIMGLDFWREQSRKALALETKAGVKAPSKIKKNASKGGQLRQR